MLLVKHEILGLKKGANVVPIENHFDGRAIISMFAYFFMLILSTNVQLACLQLKIFIVDC